MVSLNLSKASPTITSIVLYEIKKIKCLNEFLKKQSHYRLDEIQRVLNTKEQFVTSGSHFKNAIKHK